jgi:hypothetical protein
MLRAHLQPLQYPPLGCMSAASLRSSLTDTGASSGSSCTATSPSAKCSVRVLRCCQGASQSSPWYSRPEVQGLPTPCGCCCCPGGGITRWCFSQHSPHLSTCKAARSVSAVSSAARHLHTLAQQCPGGPALIAAPAAQVLLRLDSSSMRAQPGPRRRSQCTSAAAAAAAARPGGAAAPAHLLLQRSSSPQKTHVLHSVLFWPLSRPPRAAAAWWAAQAAQHSAAVATLCWSPHTTGSPHSSTCCRTLHCMPARAMASKACAALAAALLPAGGGGDAAGSWLLTTAACCASIAACRSDATRLTARALQASVTLQWNMTSGLMNA